MPTYHVTSPDGATYEVTAPEGATEQDALAYVKKNHDSLQKMKVGEADKAPGFKPGQNAQTMAKSDNPANLADGGMSGLRKMVEDKPGRVYGDVLPASRDTATGEWHFPVLPEAAREVVRGAADLLEGTKTGVVTPQATNTLAALVGARGAGLRSVAEAPSVATAAAPSVVQNALSPRAMLREGGVTLTPGQLAGGLAKSTEDKLTSVPILGDAISSARRRGISEFNIATIDRSLEPIGVKLPKGTKAGEPAIEAGQAALEKAYGDLLPGVRFHADPEFMSSVKGLHDLTKEMPTGERDQFEAILNQRVMSRLGKEGNMDGQTLKQVESELGQKVGQLKAGKQYQLSDAVRELRETIRDTLERQNPDQASRLKDINRAYAMFSRAEDASIRRPTAGGMFSPGDLLAEIKSNAKRTGNKKSYARGDALLKDWASAANDVLPNKIPDSGTIGRGLLAAGAYEASNMLHHPEILLGLAAGAVPYTKPGMVGLNWLANVSPSAGNFLARVGRQGIAAAAPRSLLFAPNPGPQPAQGQ